MTYYDISLPISESLVTWPGDPPLRITQPAHLERGDDYTVSRLEMGAHTGTHVDAPAHFVIGGRGVDELDLDALIGPACVVHVLAADALTADVLAGLPIPAGTERVLFRTRNSAQWLREAQTFVEDYVAIVEDGARWLVERGIRLVGVDYLSVGAFDRPAPTHEVLLHAGVVVVEGLDLNDIAPGSYDLICLPLRIVGGDGAPARAVLINREE
jgi:arylformamidase